MSDSVKVIFLHHSTGKGILRGSVGKIPAKLGIKGDVFRWFDSYNKKNERHIDFKAQIFPKPEVYGWNNYPFDYYNIWVKNAGEQPYKDEPTLEMLTRQYDVIVFKHCFPVSSLIPSDSGNIDSPMKSVANYKLQYLALKEKLRQFPDTKFILWTGAALVKNVTNETEARLADGFFTWVVSEWDEKGDNIYLWDFRTLETKGNIYMADENAAAPDNPHPGRKFAAFAAPLFCKRVVDVIEGSGDTRKITGED